MLKSALFLISILFLHGCSSELGDGKSSGNSTTNTTTGVLGEYGFLTDYSNITEDEARNRIAMMVNTYGIKEFQFYDWFGSYSGPPTPDQVQWLDPYLKQRPVYRSTIEIYIDEIHKQGGRAWAYVQSVASENKNLAQNGSIYKVIDENGDWYQRSDQLGFHFVAYFLNAAWAQ